MRLLLFPPKHREESALAAACTQIEREIPWDPTVDSTSERESRLLLSRHVAHVSAAAITAQPV